MSCNGAEPKQILFIQVMCNNLINKPQISLNSPQYQFKGFVFTEEVFIYQMCFQGNTEK